MSGRPSVGPTAPDGKKINEVYIMYTYNLMSDMSMIYCSGHAPFRVPGNARKNIICVCGDAALKSLGMRGVAMVRKNYIAVIVLLSLVGGMATLACLRGSRVRIAIMTRLQSGSTIGSSEINASKLFLEGPGGRSMEVVPFNDDWEPGQALQAYSEMRSLGMDILVTSHVSTCALALRDSINRDGVLTMVTGASTDELTGRDDWIFRTIPDVSSEQKSIAGYINAMPGNSLLIIRDTDNHSYTTPALRYFMEALRKRSARIIDVSVSSPDMAALEASIRARPFDSVYMLIGGYKAVAGSMAQMAARINPGARIVFTPWIKTPELLRTLGRAVGNSVIPSHYPPRGESAAVDEYITIFRKRFGYSPTFISLNVYAALEILASAISAGHKRPGEIKAYLLEKRRFDTRFGPVEFDAYGDSMKPLYFITDLENEF